MYDENYYLTYFASCAALVGWLTWMLRRCGSIFLRDAFRNNPEVIRALGRLLDLGLYLVGGGYAAVSFRYYQQFMSPGQVALAIVWRLGGLLLLLGVIHSFNLLTLAIFRQRAVRAARTGELS